MKDRIHKLKNHADILLNGYLGLHGTLAVFKPMAYEQAVVDKHAAGQKNRAFHIIRRTLFFSCVLDITKLAFDDDRKTPSFFNLIEALKEDAVRAALRDGYSRGKELEFDGMWENIRNRWTEFNEKPWVVPFKTIRDKWIAHLEVNARSGEYKTLDVSSFNLKWGDTEDAVKLLEPIMLDMMPVICNTGHVISAVTEDYEKAGKSFWV